MKYYIIIFSNRKTIIDTEEDGSDIVRIYLWIPLSGCPKEVKILII